jgi:hypothetical protein
MTPSDLKRRREALGLTQPQLGAKLWDNPQSGRVTVVSLESGRTPMSKRMSAWLDQELTRLEAARTQPQEGRR